MENWFIVLRQGQTVGKKYQTIDEAQQDGAVTENVGRFLQVSLNFVLVAITLFFIIFAVKKISDYRAARREKMDGKPEPGPATGATQTCPWCGSNVPVKAVKCMFCTSFLHEKVPAELLNKQPQQALIELDG